MLVFQGYLVQKLKFGALKYHVAGQTNFQIIVHGYFGTKISNKRSKTTSWGSWAERGWHCNHGTKANSVYSCRIFNFWRDLSWSEMGNDVDFYIAVINSLWN